MEHLPTFGVNVCKYLDLPTVQNVCLFIYKTSQKAGMPYMDGLGMVPFAI